MKTKTYSLPLFTLLITTAIYFNSCTPDETPVCGTAYNTTVNFTADDLSKVPYTGFDTLYFKDINGDTNIVVGSGKQYYYDKVYKTHGGPACPPDVTNNQAYKIQFNPIKGDLNFKFIQQRTDWSIVIRKQNYSAYFTEYYSLLDLTLPNDKYHFDSLTINGKSYYKVMLENGYNDYDGDTTYQALINKSFGLLSIKSRKENEEYTLLKK